MGTVWGSVWAIPTGERRWAWQAAPVVSALSVAMTHACPFTALLADARNAAR